MKNSSFQSFLLGGHGHRVSKNLRHEHKQICGIFPGLGGCQILFMFMFFGVVPYGVDTNKQNTPPPIPGQSRKTYVYVFFFFFVPQFFQVEIRFQLQMQNRAARRNYFHYRDRSVGMSAEDLSSQL